MAGEIIKIYGSALKKRIKELEGEYSIEIEAYCEDGIKIPILASNAIYYAKNEIEVSRVQEIKGG